MGKRTGSDTIRYALKDKPVITSLVANGDLDALLKTSSTIAFVLVGDIFSIERTVAKIQEAGKLAFVHFDLIAGIGKDQMGVRFLAHKIGADGLVTTRSNIILTAKQHHLLTIQRLFAFDSVSIDNGIKVIKGTQPDAIEVLPGMVVPRIVDRITMKLDLPIIAGGLITELTDVETALKCGAIGISTSTQQLWQWQDGNE